MKRYQFSLLLILFMYKSISKWYSLYLLIHSIVSDFHLNLNIRPLESLFCLWTVVSSNSHLIGMLYHWNAGGYTFIIRVKKNCDL